MNGVLSFFDRSFEGSLIRLKFLRSMRVTAFIDGLLSFDIWRSLKVKARQNISYVWNMSAFSDVWFWPHKKNAHLVMDGR